MKRRLWLILFIMLAACAPRTPSVARVALLAPFEGRYREVGYEALYAARLAFADLAVDAAPIELLPIDDGGTPESARDRAIALAADPQVAIAIAVGLRATEIDTLAAFGDVPVIVAGDWGAYVRANTVVLANRPARDQFTTFARFEVEAEADRTDMPIIGGDVLALRSFADLRRAAGLPYDGITILSAARLPEAAFIDRYRALDEFAPEPGLIASLTYDTAQIAVQVALAHPLHRDRAYHALRNEAYRLRDGRAIRFDTGYWTDAPLYRYTYDDSGTLVTAPDS